MPLWRESCGIADLLPPAGRGIPSLGVCGGCRVSAGGGRVPRSYYVCGIMLRMTSAHPYPVLVEERHRVVLAEVLVEEPATAR